MRIFAAVGIVAIDLELFDVGRALGSVNRAILLHAAVPGQAKFGHIAGSLVQSRRRLDPMNRDGKGVMSPSNLFGPIPFVCPREGGATSPSGSILRRRVMGTRLRGCTQLFFVANDATCAAMSEEPAPAQRSEEQTSEFQLLKRLSYAVFS